MALETNAKYGRGGFLTLNWIVASLVMMVIWQCALAMGSGVHDFSSTSADLLDSNQGYQTEYKLISGGRTLKKGSTSVVNTANTLTGLEGKYALATSGTNAFTFHYDKRVTEMQAKSYCLGYGAELLRVDSQAKQTTLANLVRKVPNYSGYTDGVWLSLYYHSECSFYVYGSGKVSYQTDIQRRYGYVHWANNQPQTGTGDCAVASFAQKLSWVTSDCTASHSFVCQWDRCTRWYGNAKSCNAEATCAFDIAWNACFHKAAAASGRRRLVRNDGNEPELGATLFNRRSTTANSSPALLGMLNGTFVLSNVGNSAYTFHYSSAQSYHDAQTFCTRFGAQLLSIPATKSKQALIEKLIRKVRNPAVYSNGVWISATCDATNCRVCKYADGRLLYEIDRKIAHGYVNFVSGEPGGGTRTGYCLVVAFSQGLKWWSDDCDNSRNAVICEWNRCSRWFNNAVRCTQETDCVFNAMDHTCRTQ